MTSFRISCVWISTFTNSHLECFPSNTEAVLTVREEAIDALDLQAADRQVAWETHGRWVRVGNGDVCGGFAVLKASVFGYWPHVYKTFCGLQLLSGCDTAFGDTHSSGFCRPSELLVCSRENIRDCPADPATRTAPSSPSPRHCNSLSTGGTADNHHSVNTTVSCVSILIP